MKVKSPKIPKSLPVKISGFLSTIFLLIVIMFTGLFTFASSQVIDKVNRIEGKLSVNPFELFPAAGGLLTGQKREPIKGEADGRTNMFLVGVDPENGATDTMLIVSYFHAEKKFVSVNIPRDLYITEAAVGGGKINAIYPVYKNMLKKDALTAMGALVEFVENEFKLPLHYWASINVNGLRQLIDKVGGVDINVENDFIDYEFPTDGYTGIMKPAPSFKRGMENMNGVRASIYARSRHAAGVEGGDFARGRRQSIVIAALLNKIKTLNLWQNITGISDYLQILGNNVSTNLETPEMISFSQLLKDVDTKKDYLKTTWQTDNGFLCSFTNNGYYIGYGVSGDCGKYIAGSKLSNPYRTKAQKYLINLLENGRLGDLQATPMLILGYNSDAVDTVISQLNKDGINYDLNNQIVGLKEKNSSTTGKPISVSLKVYIPDPKFKDILADYRQRNLPNTTLEFTDKVPDNLKLIFPGRDIAKEIIIYDQQ
jgi:LCP family protein required for cell wall assembly